MQTDENIIENVSAALDTMSRLAPAPLNPEDLTAYAITTDFHEGASKKVLTTVPVKKPARESFIRTHTDPACWQTYGILDLKEEGKIYLVAPTIVAALRDEGEATLVMANLVLSVDRRGNPFLWPLKVSDRENDWNFSARQAAEIAKEHWVRVTSNRNAGCYDAHVAKNQDMPPVWPSETYAELLKLAFFGRVIDKLDHAVLKELHGD